jgi:hypothetical protein
MAMQPTITPAPALTAENLAASDRLPWPQAALLIAAISFGLWGGLWAASAWLFGH